jgi:hypothetical protein
VIIAALISMAMIGWLCCLMFRDARSGQAASRAAAHRPATRTTTAVGLEDDLDQWQATRGAWTALDERQLTRLLTDSAAASGTPTNPADNVLPHGDHEDMP